MKLDISPFTYICLKRSSESKRFFMILVTSLTVKTGFKIVPPNERHGGFTVLPFKILSFACYAFNLHINLLIKSRINAHAANTVIWMSNI